MQYELRESHGIPAPLLALMSENTKIGDKQPKISVYLLLDWLSIQPHRSVGNVLVLLVRIETRARLRSIIPMTRYSLYVVSAAEMFE